MYRLQEHLHRRLFREDLRRKAREDAKKIAMYLKETYQAEVFGIGSAFDPERPFSTRSDIDLVVKGLPEERYFHILDEVSVMTSFRLDLIPFEDARPSILELLHRGGRKL
ncbi:MAG: hypothetical protein Kow009_00190 [Spirochaetales bacterium]